MLMAVAIPIVTAVAVYRRRDNVSAWQETGKRLGLTMRGLGGSSVLEGHVGRAEIVVDVIHKTRAKKTTPWTRIRATTDIPPGLLIGGEGFWETWNESQGDDVVDMAGVAFDEHVIVRGAVPQIFALLNNDTRAQFRELDKRYRACVIEGAVQVEQAGIMRDSEGLARLIRRVATLAMALSLQGPSIANRLGANVATDSNALVRLRNLELLLDRYEESEAARLACQHALADRSHPVAVLAAAQCGAEGIPVFERVLEDPKADHDLRFQSLEQLVGLIDLESTVALLLDIAEQDPALKATALITLANVGHDPGADVLTSLLLDESAEGWIAYAQCIALLDHKEMIEPLELFLSRDTEGGSLMPAPQTLESEDEGSVEAAPVPLSIPDELRVNLEVQEAVFEAMRTLVGWSFDDDEDTEAPDEPEDGALEAPDLEHTLSDLGEALADSAASEAHAEPTSGSSASASEVELEAHAD